MACLCRCRVRLSTCHCLGQHAVAMHGGGSTYGIPNVSARKRISSRIGRIRPIVWVGGHFNTKVGDGHASVMGRPVPVKIDSSPISALRRPHGSRRQRVLAGSGYGAGLVGRHLGCRWRCSGAGQREDPVVPPGPRWEHLMRVLGHCVAGHDDADGAAAGCAGRARSECRRGWRCSPAPCTRDRPRCSNLITTPDFDAVPAYLQPTAVWFGPAQVDLAPLFGGGGSADCRQADDIVGRTRRAFGGIGVRLGDQPGAALLMANTR